MTGPDPLEQDELTTLEAELRRALQHQRAAYERMQRTQEEMESLLRRARELLARRAVPRLPSPIQGRGPGEARSDEPG